MRTGIHTSGLAATALTLVVLFGGFLSPAIAADIAAGNKLYQERCASCHGPDGKGNTPIAKALTPPPRDHTDGAYMNKITDAQLSDVITKGGTAVGKSALMPPQADLKGDALANLIAFVRSLAVPAYPGK